MNPPPVNKGVPVTAELLKLIDPKDVHIIELLKQRDAFGFQKYGQHLMSEDGRDGIQDAKEELGDLLQYIFKSKLNGQDVAAFFQQYVKPAYKIIKKLSE